jgi:DNA-binding response OmpR family regulator
MKSVAFCTRDALLSSQLCDLLRAHGLRPEPFGGEAALMRALRHRGGMGMVLFDLGLESATEESVMSWLSCRTADALPVMLMSSRWNAQRVAGALDAGGDDCVAKPFDPVELIARIKALLRRSGSARPTSSRISLDGFELDQAEGLLIDRGVVIDLTPREFALAWLFFSNRGSRLVREAISLAIWGSDKEIASRTIEQHVYKLRKKIGLTPERGVVIRTTYGQGYQLELCSRREAPFIPAAAVGGSRLARLDSERNMPLS